jgi:hypothetical protein
MPHFMQQGMTRCARQGDDHLAGGGMDMRGGAAFHMSSTSTGGQAVGFVDEVAERALQYQAFGG